MKRLSNQHGVGLVEVLVAVLLLSVAVLGFSALQIRAISATDESLVRTKSLTVVRNLAEVMRAYPEAYVTVMGLPLPVLHQIQRMQSQPYKQSLVV